MPVKSFSYVPPDNYNTGKSDKRKLPSQNKEELLIQCGLEIPDLDFTTQHSDIINSMAVHLVLYNSIN